MKNMNFAQIINQLMGHQISQVDNLSWDLSTGQVGVRGKGGITTIKVVEAETKGRTKTTPSNSDELFELNCNPIESFSMQIPAFAIATPFSELKIQDIVVDGNNNAVGWVTKINAKTLRVLKTDGTNTTWTPPKVQIMGMPSGGVKVVKQLFNVDGGIQNLQASLLPMLMMSKMAGEDNDMSDIIQMQLFMQMTGQSNNPQANTAMGSVMSSLPMLMMMKKGF